MTFSQSLEFISKGTYTPFQTSLTHPIPPRSDCLYLPVFRCGLLVLSACISLGCWASFLWSSILTLTGDWGPCAAWQAVWLDLAGLASTWASQRLTNCHLIICSDSSLSWNFACWLIYSLASPALAPLWRILSVFALLEATGGADLSEDLQPDRILLLV